MKLVLCNNPFDPAKDRVELDIYDREHLAEYIADHHLTTDKYVLSLNGEILPPERLEALDQLALHGDDYLVAVPVLGNTTLKSIAMVGVMAAAAAFAPALGAALFPALSEITATAIASTIIGIGGQLLVSAVASLLQKRGNGSSYTFAGPQTTERSGMPIPKGYGTIRSGGNIIQSWVDLQHAELDLHDADNGSADSGRQWLNLIVCFGFGPAVSLTDLRINDKDIHNFQDVAYFVKLGTNTQGTVSAGDSSWTILNQTTTGDSPNTNPTTDFNRITNTYPQSQRVRCDVDQPYVIFPGQRNDTQRIDVTVQFPQGCWRYDENKVIKRLDIVYDVYYKLHSASTWTLAQHHVYTNIRQTLLRQTTTIDNLTPGQYDVKVVKIGSGAHNNPIYSVEHESDYFGDELWLESVQETCYDSLAYPNMILLGLRIMATDQISGANIQVSATVTYDIRTTLPTALAGYDHDNPAVVAYDVLADPLSGGGLLPANINVPAFAEWAALCDSMVYDDLGGTQKLARFNGVFEQDAKTIWDSLQSICVMSRATPTRVGTQVGVMLDQVDTPVQMFNVGNIFRDSYSKEYLNLEDRAQEIEVNYANADDDYKTRNPLRVIPQEELDTGYAIKKARVNLLGCTNTVQAYYWAEHRRRENVYLLRTHKWDSPAQAIVCRIGNLVYLQHDVPQWSVGGLLAGGSTTEIQLDTPQELDLTGTTYTLLVVYPALLRLATTITAIGTPTSAGTPVTVASYTGVDRVKRLIAGTLDVRILSYGAGVVVVDDATGLTVGMAVSLYDTEVMVSQEIDPTATAALPVAVAGARGKVTFSSSCGLCNWYFTVIFSSFTAPTLPPDAVILGIYPVIVGSAVHDGAFSYYTYGTGLSLTSINGSPINLPTDPSSTSFSRSQFYGPSIGTTLSALTGQEIKCMLNASLSRFGMSDEIDITSVGFFIDYTSATPTIDTRMDPPIAPADGHGVAWAVPSAYSETTGETNGSAYATLTTTTAAIVPTTALPADPVPDTPYILSSSISTPLTVRVRGIKRASDQKFTISAIDYDPNVYDIPTPNDLSAVTSGGSGGGSATTPDPTTTPPPAPPTGVVNPGDPGYGGQRLPSSTGNYTQSPVTPLSQTNATTIALATTTTTFGDSVAVYNARTFTIADPGSTPTWYYVTIADSTLTGDVGGGTTLTAYCEASTAKIGVTGYTYLGAVLATHAAGAHSPVTPGGWPIPSTVEAVS